VSQLNQSLHTIVHSTVSIVVSINHTIVVGNHIPGESCMLNLTMQLVQFQKRVHKLLFTRIHLPITKIIFDIDIDIDIKINM
jgi:hypothetical protein